MIAYEVLATGYWSGRSIEVAETDPIPSGWTRTPVPELQTGEYAVWAGGDWAVTTQAFAPAALPSPPTWNEFNATLLADVRLNQVCGAALQAGAVVAVTGLPAALSQVVTNGVAAFALVFNAVCQLGGATTEDRENWAAIAEANNLPAEFAQVIRG